MPTKKSPELRRLSKSALAICHHLGPAHFDILLFCCCSVHIKGEPDEEAVLCTSNKTYAVKFVGSSNTMFMVPPDSSKEGNSDRPLKETNAAGACALISFAAPGYMELVETAPRVDTLRALLSRNKYDQVSCYCLFRRPPLFINVLLAGDLSCVISENFLNQPLVTG